MKRVEKQPGWRCGGFPLAVRGCVGGLLLFFLACLPARAFTLSATIQNGSGSSAYLWLTRASDGAIVDGPTTSTLPGASISTPKNYADTFSAYGVSSAAWGTWSAANGGVPYTSSTHAQRIAAGGVLASPASKAFANTANDSVSFVWTGTSPPSWTNYTYQRCLTNTSGLVTHARVTTTRTGSGATLVTTYTVQPGQPLCVDVQDTNKFTVKIETEVVLPDGLGTGWAGDAENPTGTNTVYSTPTPVETKNVTNGNIWNNQTVTNTYGAIPDVTATTITRTNVSSSTGDVLQRQIEANNDQRQSELRSLMVAADKAQGNRDALQLDALNQGFNRLAAAVNASGINISNSVAGLRSSLEAGTNNAALGVGTNVTSGAVQAGTGTARTVLGGLVPAVTIPPGEAPVINLQLSLLHSSLADAEFDFGDEHLEPIVTTVRALELVGCSVLFLVLSIKLIGKAANV